MSALAIEPPADTSQPPAAMLKEEAWDLSQEAIPKESAPEAGKIGKDTEAREETPFFGVGTAAVPEMLAYHLTLEPDRGLLVRTVYPGSPAEKAGISVNDIILKVGESEVGNPEALTTAVGQASVGDRVAIGLIHKGKPAKIEATFTGRPAELTGMASPRQALPMLEGLPKEHREMLRRMIDQNMQAFGSGGNALPNAERIEKHFREMQERMNRAMEESDPAAGSAVIRSQMNSTVRVMDGSGSIEILSGHDGTNVTVRDTSNKVTWSGPWDTDEEKAAAPGEIRERVDRIKTGSGFRLNLGKLDGVPGLR